MHTFLLDQHGTVLWLSHGDELHSPDVLVGRKFWELVPESEIEVVRNILAAAVIDQRSEESILTSAFAPMQPQYRVRMLRLEAASVIATSQRVFPPKVTLREKEILALIASDVKPHDIAARLNLSPNTVDSYRRNLKEKLGVSGTAGLVKWAVRTGLTAP